MTYKHTMSVLGGNKKYITITLVDYTTYIDGFNDYPSKINIEDFYHKLCPEAKNITTTIYKQI